MPRLHKPKYPKNPASDYMWLILKGKIPSGPSMKWIAQRHFKTLKNKKYYLDLEEFDKICSYFEDNLKILSPDGTEIVPFKLFDYQKFVILDALCFRIKKTGLRLRRRVWIDTPKGSGKSPLIAGILLYLMEHGPEAQEMVCLCEDIEQSKAAFKEICKFLQLSDHFKLDEEGSENWRIIGGVNPQEIHYFPKRSFIKRFTISKQVNSSRSGWNISVLWEDEMHEASSDETLRTFELSQKRALEPLTFITTNAYRKPEDICHQYTKSMQNIIQDILPDDTYSIAIFDCEDDDDPWPLYQEIFESERNGEKPNKITFNNLDTIIRKCNPGYPLVPRPDYVFRELREGMLKPYTKGKTGRLIFSKPASDETFWIDKMLVDPCIVDELSPNRKERKCIISLDLSQKNDLTAGIVAWDFVDRLEVECFNWLPEKNMTEREDRDGVPYSQWIDEGFIIPVPGVTIDYEWVADWLHGIVSSNNVQAVVYDQWQMNIFKKELAKYSIELVDDPKLSGILGVSHPQQFQKNTQFDLYMPESIHKLEKEFSEGTIKILRNSCFLWQIMNGALNPNATGDQTFNKKTAYGRIDALIALTQAVGFMRQAKKILNTQALKDYLDAIRK